MTSPWLSAPLGTVATLQRGFDLPTRLRVNGNVPIVSSSGVSGWHNAAMVRGPGVVTGRYGTIGQLFYLDCDYWPLNTTLWVSNFHGNHPEFIYYMLQRVDFATHSGKSGVPGVNRNDLHVERVVVPSSRAEQQRIAGSLTIVDNLIATIEKLIDKKQAIKQGMMQQLLTGKTRLPGFTEPWRDVTVGDLTDQHRRTVDPRRARGRRFQHFSLPAFDEGQRPVIELGSSIDSIKFVVPRGAVLVSKLNPRIPRIWAPDVVDSSAIASTEFVVMTPTQGTDGSFLKWVMKSIRVVSLMKLLATGTTGSHARIHPRQVAAIEVAVPPEREQMAIAAALDDVEREIGLLRQRLAKARDIKQGMMQQLLTGLTRLPLREGAA